MPCPDLGQDNWLTCPHLDNMLRMKTKLLVLSVLFHTACTHKGTVVEISSGFLIPVLCGQRAGTRGVRQPVPAW